MQTKYQSLHDLLIKAVAPEANASDSLASINAALGVLRTLEVYEDLLPFAEDSSLIFPTEKEDFDFRGSGLSAKISSEGLMLQALKRQGLAESDKYVDRISEHLRALLSALSLGQSEKAAQAKGNLDQAIEALSGVLRR